MTSKRVPLALVLCAVLFVTAGLAATKKFHRNDGSRAWNDLLLQNDSSLQNDSPAQNDLSLQNGDLPSAGGSASTSGGSDLLSGGGPSGVPVPRPANSPDNWNGGFGNWSIPGNWTNGVPGPGSDVTIYSGGIDTVTLDVGSTTVRSLVLGGANNGFFSILTDRGVAQAITITNALTVGYTGELSLTGGTYVTAGAGSSNAGVIDLENASTLKVTGDVSNSGRMFTDEAGYGGGNTLIITGTLTNSYGFGVVGSGDVATLGGFINSYQTFLDNGGTLTISGGATNSGFLGTGAYGGGNTLTVSGTLTTLANSNLQVYGFGDRVTLGALENAGEVTVTGGSCTLSITGNLTNNGSISIYGVGDKVSVGGGLANGGGFILEGNGSIGTIGGGLTNSGYVNLENGSTLQINGDANNSSGLYTGVYEFGGGNKLNIAGNLANTGVVDLGGQGQGDMVTITGTLTNNGGFMLDSSGDVANVGKLTNNDYTLVESGATLNLTNQLGGITDAVAGSTFVLYGTFYDTLGMASGFANLNSVEGGVSLYGQNLTITPGSGTLTISDTGGLTANYNPSTGLGTTLTINGNVDNSGLLNSRGHGTVLTITGTLTNNQPGTFYVLGSQSVANVGTLNNGGFVAVGGTLNLTNQPDGVTDVVAGSYFDLAGSFIAGANNGFYKLTSVEGTLIIENGQVGSATPIGGTLTVSSSGYLDLEGGTAGQVNGNLSNGGFVLTDYYGGGGGNTLNITGTLTNQASGQFILFGPGDTATIGSVVNSGLIDLENNSNLTVNGDVNNSGNIYTSDLGGSGHNTITINGMLNNISGGQVVLFNPTDMLILNGGGGMNLSNGSALSTPTLNNGGTINVDNLSTLLVGIGVLHGPITNYTQLANGTLGEIITPNSFGVINLHGGSALLAGTLDILLQGGFNPAVGKMYKFLIGVAPGQLSGTFASILNDVFNNGTEKWVVDYENGGGFVELIAEPNGSPVPEPATLLVLIPGLLGAGYGLRRRLSK